MASATPQFGGQWIPSIRESTAGFVIRQPYLVNTSEEALAYAAGGLPAVGTAHPIHPNSYCVSRDWEFGGGKDGGGGESDRTGWSIMWLEYAPLTVASFDLVYDPGESYSEVRPTDGQISIRYSTEIGADGKPIAIPETQREAMQSEILVAVYATSNAPWVSCLAFADTINGNSVVMPPPFGVGPNIVQPPKTLKWRSPEISLARPGVLKIIFRFGIGIPEWTKFRYRKEDEAGDPIGPEIARDIYDTALWPTNTWWGL